MRRVCIIGLDCATPQLVFGSLRERLPNLSALAASGIAGPLESCVPPITVPAWSAMVTGCDPGTLGIYGFRGRADRSYERRRLASSLDVHQPTLWSLATRAGLTSRVISVPQSYPPKPLRGALVSDCLTPSHEVPFTHPPELAEEVQELTGGYVFDVAEHRTMPRARLRQAIHEMTRRRFCLARAWLKERDWQLFMMVEMGPDRMQHAFWRYFARDHWAYANSHPDADVLGNYYATLDAEIGTLLALLTDDDVVLVVSDHGARTMHGGIALNQWLAQEGYLQLRSAPREPTPFDPSLVDWQATRAWADGGYVGRIYFNIAGREPEGILAAADAEAFAHELKARLLALRGPDGQELATRVYRPQEIYREVRGVAPDLTVYFDDLAYRALGSLGHPGIYVRDNDTGPDDANHARCGIFIMRGALARGWREDLTLYDVAPTALHHLGVSVPAHMGGRIIS